MMIGHATEDAKLEQIIRRILRIGVATSGAFLALGLAWSFVSPGSPAGALLMTIGLFILMGTPVTRVAASVVEYAVGGVIAALVFHRRL